MLIKNCIYCISILLSLFSIVLFIYSIKNKNKYVCKKFVMLSVIFIVYLIANLSMIGTLSIPVGMEILLIYFMVCISVIIYLITIILNLIKRKKLKVNTNNKNILIGMIILPVIFLMLNVLTDKYFINNSNLIVVYHSSGNGGFDSDTFAYAIGDNFCKQFDLGIDIDGYNLHKFLPKSAMEINNIDDVLDYRIEIDESARENDVIVYKNGKNICKITKNADYFNIEFERGFYIVH